MQQYAKGWLAAYDPSKALPTGNSEFEDLGKLLQSSAAEPIGFTTIASAWVENTLADRLHCVQHNGVQFNVDRAEFAKRLEECKSFNYKNN